MLGAGGQLTISGSTVISQEQLVPGGYFLSGQLGVLISPWAFVNFPPQNCWSETSWITMNCMQIIICAQ